MRSAETTETFVLSLADLAQLIGAKPKKFPEGLVARNDFVYEVDADLIDPEDNPHGVGDVVGAVLDPHGDTLKVKWFDDNGVENTPKKFLRKAPQIGEIEHDGNKCYEVLGYSYQGCKMKTLPKEDWPRWFKILKLKQKREKAKSIKVITATTAKPRTKRKKKVSKKKTKTKDKKADDENIIDDSDWMVCRASTLDAKQMATLQTALAGIKLPPGWTAAVFEVYAERSLREYMDLQKSDVHKNCNKILRAAISQVMAQVRPVISRPFEGDVTKASVTLMPALRKV